MQTRHQPIGTHYDWSLWQAVVPLSNTFQVFSRGISLSDSSRREIQHLVTIVADISI